ncbi:hypothetical protein CB1_000273067 [Camelus ferus]|nr:hypothetical protein CB1_000273067 [Camelus ferus]
MHCTFYLLCSLKRQPQEGRNGSENSSVRVTEEWLEEREQMVNKGETKTVEEIDEALKIAGQNFEELSIAVKIIRTLKLTFESELSQVSSLKLRSSPKCDPQENEIGQNVLKNNNHKKEFACSRTQPSLKKKKFDISVLTNEAPPTPLRWETNNVHLESKNFQPQKDVVATTSPKTTAALPQMGSSPDVIIEEIIEENLESARVFVNSIENGMWCRGTITELIPIGSENIRRHSPTKYLVHEVALIQIFMVDFGNSEVLVVTGVGDTHVRSEHTAKQHVVLNDLCLVLRKSEPYVEELLKDMHPLALPCSLKDIVPQNSNEGWGEEAKVEFLKMVNKKAVLMKVFKKEDGVLIVDLQKPPTNKISSDMPVSLRDALVFMELASLGEKMFAVYENSKWEPIKWENDMHCAVKIPDKNQWRRGQIIRVITDTLVKVLLYDVGVELVVNTNCLRELQENLKTMGRLSLECSLVDIRPTGGSDKWTATACDCLSLYLTGAMATIIVQKSLETPLEQDESAVTKCIKINCDPDKKAADTVSEHRVSEFKEKILEPRTAGSYRPPAIPTQKVFEAIVSCIGDDGTVFVVPKSSEPELMKMMNEIQSNLKCLGLLESYFWKKGEACAVRGSDTLWYRGRVVEVVGGTIRVQYLDHGFTEKIPQCHLYPVLLCPDRPQFCIPCQLCNTIPVYICLDSVENCTLCNQHSDTEDSGVAWESESEGLTEALRRVNKNVETFPPLTDFRTAGIGLTAAESHSAAQKGQRCPGSDNRAQQESL